MKQQNIDVKSLIMGMMVMTFLMFSFAFNSGPSTPNEQKVRYQAAAAERGFIILDTYTGDYILDSEVNYIGKMNWIKGNFHKSFERGKDKTSR